MFGLIAVLKSHVDWLFVFEDVVDEGCVWQLCFCFLFSVGLVAVVKNIACRCFGMRLPLT